MKSYNVELNVLIIKKNSLFTDCCFTHVPSIATRIAAWKYAPKHFRDKSNSNQNSNQREKCIFREQKTISLFSCFYGLFANMWITVHSINFIHVTEWLHFSILKIAILILDNNVKSIHSILWKCVYSI